MSVIDGIADGSCQTCHGTGKIYFAGVDNTARPCPVCCSHIIPDRAVLHEMRDLIVKHINAKRKPQSPHKEQPNE